MGMKYFIVIGKEKDTDDNPLAETLCQIGKAMGKDIRVFVTSSTGISEFGSKVGKKLTKDVVLETLASFDKSDYRLLLFDAESISGKLNPVSGLLLWHQYYCNLHPCKETIYIDLKDKDILGKLFDKENNGLCWTGIVEPGGYDVATLAETRWKGVNSRLKHESQKQGGSQ